MGMVENVIDVGLSRRDFVRAVAGLAGAAGLGFGADRVDVLGSVVEIPCGGVVRSVGECVVVFCDESGGGWRFLGSVGIASVSHDAAGNAIELRSEGWDADREVRVTGAALVGRDELSGGGSGCVTWPRVVRLCSPEPLLAGDRIELTYRMKVE